MKTIKKAATGVVVPLLALGLVLGFENIANPDDGGRISANWLCC